MSTGLQPWTWSKKSMIKKYIVAKRTWKVTSGSNQAGNQKCSVCSRTTDWRGASGPSLYSPRPAGLGERSVLMRSDLFSHRSRCKMQVTRDPGREIPAPILFYWQSPVNTKHLYSICTMLDQRRKRWADVVQMLYKCFVFTGNHLQYTRDC